MELPEPNDLVLVEFKDHYTDDDAEFINIRATNTTESIMGRVIRKTDSWLIVAWWFELERNAGKVVEIFIPAITKVTWLVPR